MPKIASDRKRPCPVCVAAAFAVLSATAPLLHTTDPAWSQDRPEVTNLPHKGIVTVPRPGQLDAPIINAIADIGAQQLVLFPEYANVAKFIGKKCGQASLTVTV